MMENNSRLVPFSPPDITDEEIKEVIDTLKSGWITTGPKTKLFEKQIAQYCNTLKAVTMNSATAALEMTLRLLGIGAGDEVITTAYTFTASASAIHHVGAKIIMVDTGVDSFHMNYDAIITAVTKNTKAIIPVDIAGVMCDYDRILEIVRGKADLFHATNELQRMIGRIIIISDAAHSFGSEYKGRKSGEVADFTCFSFHAVKNLTTAEGGAVTWRNINGIDNDEIYRQYMLLSLHGQSKDAFSKLQLGSWEYDIVATNYKCNMTDITASIGIAQLNRYCELLEKRRKIIKLYDSLLSELNVSALKHSGTDYSSNGHLYMLRINGYNELFRNRVIELMAKYGIATNVHYKPLPMHTAYKNLGFDIKDYPNAFRMYQNEITLPLHTLLSLEDVEYVVFTLKEILATLDRIYMQMKIAI